MYVRMYVCMHVYIGIVQYATKANVEHQLCFITQCHNIVLFICVISIL